MDNNSNIENNHDDMIISVPTDNPKGSATASSSSSAAEGAPALDQMIGQHSSSSKNIDHQIEEIDHVSLCSSWDGQSTVHSPAPNHANKAKIRAKSVSFNYDLESCHDAGSMIHRHYSESIPEDIPDVVVNPGYLLSMIFSCTKWNKARLRRTLLGLLSCHMILAIRLYLDIEPLVYFIHSIVIYVDMLLIHLFTDSVWLSLSGELVTVAMVLAYHFTKETVWELMETTVLAALCSFHMIHSRHKHMVREEELHQEMKAIYRHTSDLLEHASHPSHRSGLSARHLDRMPSEGIHWDSERNLAMKPQDNDHIKDMSACGIKHSVPVKKAKIWGKEFFEHFLDGSAGVMYTSFLGLIISEFIRYGEGKG